ncbi:hypothetical protein [Chryseobacterium sp.]|uniref:hypothetical protein n=1 Tax=Chryseobacterium sp. TaxID=1871047 RepID=UPI0011C7974F|nr:hypothetical protein [Chryseobacterium sp.]TXF79224.1 hypothetical protein FUA25_02180 [Chryseobacterium sp.]
MKNPFKIVFILFFASCHPKTAEISFPEKFRTVKATDSTSFIEWTDGKTVYRSSKTIDKNYVDNKTYCKWSNDQYICLRHSTGSDTWTDIILPFNHNHYKLFENALAYDKNAETVICETDSAGFKLVAENIENGKKEFIGREWVHCGSVFPHYCIDSINVRKNILYVEWTIPHIDHQNKKQIIRIKLKI